MYTREDAMMLVLTMADMSNPSVNRCTSGTKNDEIVFWETVFAAI
jgi:hypothetical protein